MIKKILLIMVCTIFASSVLADDNGIIRKKSIHSVTVTLDRLENILTKKGITVALRWKHSDKAKGVGISIAETEILIFGNPKLGSPLMQSNPEIGIDLPMKALVYKDANGQVWLAYNDPAYLKQRHGITDKGKVFARMSGALNKLTNKAVGK